MWHVYILLCEGNTYYIGISNNVQKRFLDHTQGRGGAYTRSHKPIEIIYTERHKDKSSALKREFQLKKWPKIKKEALVARDQKLKSPHEV